MAVGALTTGKIAEVLFENAMETYEEQDMLLNKVSTFEPDAATLQNAENAIWRTVQQHAPNIQGWDLSGQETGIIQETYPALLGTPNNDYVAMRVDKLRDKQFWVERGRTSGRQQATDLNKAIANAIATQGSMFYRSNATSGYNFIAEAQALMNERQQANDGRYFLLNDRSNLKFGSDLAGRQTLQGRPETTWETGQIGQNVAEFDVYTGSFLPNLAGGADPATTVTANQSFKPEGGTVDPVTGIVTNIDYRRATIPVTASASYNVGDKITFANGGVAVTAVGLADKSSTGQAMTFTIVAKPSATSITVYPKPIALDDPALNVLEKAYANVNTRILNNATVNRVNVTASIKTNLFWEKNAVEVMQGTIPADLFRQFEGMKVVHERMKNGQEMYMLYSGEISDMSLRWRLFTWYGITVKDPSRCGVAESF